MNQFIIDVPDPRDVPFVRALLLGLRQVSLLDEPALSAAEEAREQTDAQAAYDRYKANPDQHFYPLKEAFRMIDEGRVP